MIIELERFGFFDKGVLGKMTFPSGLELFTIERPWRDNQPFISCIPSGEYTLEWDITGRVRNVPRLRGTAPRTQINIHVANKASELHGCIAPGLTWAFEGTEPLVRDSAAAWGLMMETMEPLLTAEGADMIAADGSLVTLVISSFSC